MAVITITEILGGDNLAGSRTTINDNFKRLANGVNTIETRLDTSFTPGGALNIGNALIRRYTNPTSAQIFTCEATGLFQGNLNVSLDLGVTQSINVGLDLTVSRNAVLDGSAIGGGSFLSQVRSTFENEFVNQQLWDAIPSAPVVDPQTLLPANSTTRVIPSVIGHSVLRLDLSNYLTNPSNNCDTIELPAVGSGGCTDGQILNVLIDVPSVSALAVFQISNTNFATGYTLPISIGNVSTPDTDAIRKLAVTLIADHNGWRVLNIAQGIAGDIQY